MSQLAKLILSLVAAAPVVCLAQSVSPAAPKAVLVLVTGSSTGTYDRDALIKMLDESLSRARPKTQ